MSTYISLFLYISFLNDNNNYNDKTSLTKRLEDEDDSDGGFKRRPKIRSSIAIDQRYSWTEPGIHIPLSTSSNQIQSMVTPCLPLRPPSVICYESNNQHRHFLQQQQQPAMTSQLISNIHGNTSILPCQAYNCSTSPVPITYHRYIGSNMVHPSDHRSIQYQVCTSSSIDAPSGSGVIPSPSTVTASASGVASCNLLTQQQQQQSQLEQGPTATTKCTMTNVTGTQQPQLYHSTCNVSQCSLLEA